MPTGVRDQAGGAFGPAAVPRPLGSSLMPLRRTPHQRVHFHVCALDGACEQMPGVDDADTRYSILTTGHRLPPGQYHR